MLQNKPYLHTVKIRWTNQLSQFRILKLKNRNLKKRSLIMWGHKNISPQSKNYLNLNNKLKLKKNWTKYNGNYLSPVFYNLNNQTKIKQNKKYQLNLKKKFQKYISIYFFILPFINKNNEIKHIENEYKFSTQYSITKGTKGCINRKNLSNAFLKYAQTNELKKNKTSSSIRFRLSGRLNGVRMKRKYVAYSGNISTQTFSINSNYLHKNIYTKWGTLGLRVWSRSFTTWWKKQNAFFIETGRLNPENNSLLNFMNNLTIIKGAFNPLHSVLRRAHTSTEVKSILKKYKPVTPSLRHRLILKRVVKSYIKEDNGGNSSNLIKNNFFKKQYKRQLISKLNKTSGRNNQGRITSFRKGGGHKQAYRKIDLFKQEFVYSVAEVVDIEYNPNSNANLALLKLVFNNKKKYFYIVAPEKIQIGDKIKGIFFNEIYKHFFHLLSDPLKKTNTNSLQWGESYFLKDIPVGSYIYNVELLPGKGSVIARSAGTYCILLKTLSNNKSIIKLPSNQVIEVNSNCTANLGQVSNSLLGLLF